MHGEVLALPHEHYLFGSDDAHGLHIVFVVFGTLIELEELATVPGITDVIDRMRLEAVTRDAV
jgi:hypothetical protein